MQVLLVDTEAIQLPAFKLYGAPVLLSGLATLVLTKAEETIIEQHFKEVISNTQRMLPGTPRSVIYFLAGSLPGIALLHLRRLSIFGMICRLPENVLHTHAVNFFSSVTTPSKPSWFFHIREVCLQYCLPHPLELLRSQISKQRFKTIMKKHVINYWEILLRAEAAALDSLSFFNTKFCSLSSPHPMWSTAGSSPAKVAMCTIQGQMVSGRFRTEELCSNRSNNKAGTCLLSPECSSTPEDIFHILHQCPALESTRSMLRGFTFKYCEKYVIIKDLVSDLSSTTSPRTFCQVLLDCSSIPSVISLVQTDGEVVLHHLYHVTRT